MTLEQDIADIRAGIKAGRFSNEASVSQGIVLRLLNALSWPTYDTSVVCPEYSLAGRRVDYALCHPADKPIAFIEVKQIGQSCGAERQLFEYAFHVGVPLAILTDGQEWNFFLPGEQGDYGERRVYKLDIVEREISECVARLERYLKHDAVASGVAINNAREDYRNVSKARQIQAALPIAWQRLLDDEDEMLLEVVADRVENLCGFKPDPDAVAQFLKGNVAGQYVAAVQQPAPPRVIRQTTSTHEPLSRQIQNRPSTLGFILDGKNYPARNACDVMLKVFEALTLRDKTFPERFAALPVHGRTRRYIAQNRDDLYPGRPDLCREHSIRLQSGWWVSTNHSRATIGRIIEMACGVVGLQYGSNLQANLGE